MNTKGKKFLAVLAVLALAFTAVTLTASDETDAYTAPAVETNRVDVQKIIEEDRLNLSTIDDDSSTSYYYSESMSVKIQNIADDVKIYVNNGQTVELKISSDVDAEKTIMISTVSGERTSKWEYTDSILSFETVASTKTVTMEYTALTILDYNLNDVDDKGEIKSGSKAIFDYNDTMKMLSSGKLTQVAQGAEITLESYSSDVMKFVFGIQFDGKTFLAPGATLSKQTLEKTGDNVVIKKGSATVYDVKGDYVTVAGLESANLKIEATDAGLDISGTTGKKGTISIFTAAATQDVGAGEAVISVATINNTVTILNGAVVKGSFTISEDAKLVLKNATGVDGTITNNGVISAENVKLWDVLQSMSISGEGMIDTTSISKTVTISGGEIESMNIGVGQVAKVIANTNVTGAWKVEGVLSVEPGITLTVNEGAQLNITGEYAIINNNGTIVSKVFNDGTQPIGDDSKPVNAITIENNATFHNYADGIIKTQSQKLKAGVTQPLALVFNTNHFTNEGRIEVGKNDAASFTQAITNQGTIAFSGTVKGTINTSGSISLNQVSLSDNLTINITSVDAEVTVTQVTAKEDKKLTITNIGLPKGKDDITAVESTVTLGTDFESGDAEDYVIRGITVGATKAYRAGDTTALVIKGNLGMTMDKDSERIPIITLDNNIVVKDTFVLPKGVSIVADDQSWISVPGTMTLVADSDADELKAELSVSGKFNNNVNATLTIVEGAEYTTASGSIVTNLIDAITEAVAANINTLDVYGYPTITSDLTIPENMTINGEAEMTISGARVVVPSTSSLSVKSVTVSKGQLYSPYESSISSEVYAAVKIAGDDEVTYMDLITAIESNISYIELNNNVFITKDMTIPSGISIDTGEDKVVTVRGAELTIEGRLIITNQSGLGVYDSHENLAGVTVEGFYQYVGSIGENSWWYPEGVLYKDTIDDVEYSIITSVKNLSYAISESEDKEIAITGNTKLGDIVVAGTEDEPVTLNFDGDVSAGTIMLSDASVYVKEGDVNATFASADGWISIINGKVTKLTVTEDGKLTASGEVSDLKETNNDSAYQLTTGGNVYLSGFTAEKGEYSQQAKDAGITQPDFEVSGTTTATGRSVTIHYGIIVYGAFVADNSSRVTIEGDVEVLGSLVAMEKTSTQSAGSISIEKTGENTNLYVGSTYDDLVEERAKATASMAIVSGNISVGGTVYVLAEAVFDEGIVEDMKELEIDIDGTPYLYVYNSTGQADLNGFKLPVEEAKISGVYDLAGDEVKTLKLSEEYNAISMINPFNFSTIPYVNVAVDYNAYSVTIYTDNGVKSVAIDGVVLRSSMTDNAFTTTKNIAAGTHKVTYTLKDGYEGTPVLTDMEGKTLSGNQIPIDGAIGNKQFTLAGTSPVEPEPTPEPEKESEWTITTILLLVLVVLIAIMAVIVAMRLMRS